MPLYEYKCPACEFRFEKLSPVVKEAEWDFLACPRCKCLSVRVMSSPNWTFGWRLSDESHLPGHKDEFVRDI